MLYKLNLCGNHWCFAFFNNSFLFNTAFSLIFGRFLPGRAYFSIAKISWEINVGGFDTSSYDSLMCLAFFLYTVINPIIMSNLLISVMSDTFKRVNNQSIIADNREFAGMILEAELILLWRRKDNCRDYLHLCKSQEEIYKVGKLEPLNALKKKISILTKNQKLFQFINIIPLYSYTWESINLYFFSQNNFTQKYTVNQWFKLKSTKCSQFYNLNYLIL